MTWEDYPNNDMLEQERADLWHGFHDRFMELAREEQGRDVLITRGKTLQAMEQLLRASCSYKEHPVGWERGKPEQGYICLLKTPPHGMWNYDSDGISENFFERVRLCVAQAGRALADYPKGADPEDFWLHRLYRDLRKNDSDLLFAASEEGGIILSVCLASATFCTRLERQALQQSEPGGQKIPSESTERGTAENTDKTQQNAESTWQGIEIVFLSDVRVEICSGEKSRKTYNYGELGFEDRRKGAPNRAWITLREMATHGGAIPRPAPGKARAMIQKRMEEIRQKLRGHFGIKADPIPFNGNTYQASFKISCGASFEA